MYARDREESRKLRRKCVVGAIRRVVVRHFTGSSRNKDQPVKVQGKSMLKGKEREKEEEFEAPEDHFFADALCVITSSSFLRSPRSTGWPSRK